MPVRVADANGNLHLDAALKGIAYAIEKWANIINISWGNNIPSTALYNVLLSARTARITVVAAAGNEGLDRAAYPARWGTNAAGNDQLDNIISVIATDRNDQLAPHSNFGEDEAHIGAPGVDILSTTPVRTTQAMAHAEPPVDPQYARLSGSSAAAAQVSGACALALALNPNLLPEDLQRRLGSRRAVEPVLPGLCKSGGRLNLLKFLHTAVPGKILNVRTARRYPWWELKQAIRSAREGDELICQQGALYPVNRPYEGNETPLNFDGKNLILRSGDLDDLEYKPTRAEIAKTVIWGPSSLEPPHNSDAVVVLDAADGSDLAHSQIIGFTLEGVGVSGAIHLTDVSPEFRKCIIQNNKNTKNQEGGVRSIGGAPRFIQCEFLNNTAAGSGGGLYAKQVHSISIEDTLISGCSAFDGFGGGLALESAGEATIVDCNVLDNYADWQGGGIYLFESQAIVTNCNIFNNVTAWDGGGIAFYGCTDSTLENSQLLENVADLAGGAVACMESNPSLINCLIVDNMAIGHHGGAIYCMGSSPTIRNVSFIRNDAPALKGLGGAVYCESDLRNTGSSPLISDCIFADNNDIAIVEGDEFSEPTVQYCLSHNNEQKDYHDYQSQRNFLITSLEATNIAGDPMFVPGRLGPYYLSQFEAGQFLDVDGNRVIGLRGEFTASEARAATSPAVDAGSDLASASAIGLHTLSTRTDNVADSAGIKDQGMVDLGYHYRDPLAPKTFQLSAEVLPNHSVGTVEFAYPETFDSPLRQFSHVLVRARSSNPNRYPFKQWIGTIDDARIDRDESGQPYAVQYNIVTVAIDIPPGDLPTATLEPIIAVFGP